MKKQQPKAVKAIYPSTDNQCAAFAVVDAVDTMKYQLQPFRAIEALAMNERTGAEESLAQLNRSDLSILLSVLTSNLEQHCEWVREAAVISAKGVAA